MKHRVLGVFSLLLALTLVAAACSKSSTPTSEGGSSGGGTITLNGKTANNHGTKDVSGGGKEEVEVDDFYFNPTVFTAHPGDKLTLTLSNESNTLHNFSVSEQSIDQDIQLDGKVTVTVTFPSSGTVVFFCKYHESKGMVGGLEVESG
jgi:plastocyanin